MAYPVDDPVWASEDIIFADGLPNKVKPTPDLESYGYAPNSFPTNAELNWLLNNLTEQIAELKLQVATPSQIPVGMVVTIDGDSSNPAVLFGYGTWQVFGQGRVIVGVGSTTDTAGQTRAFNAGTTGGEFDHKLTQSEMPLHSHSYTYENTRGVGIAGAEDGTSAMVTGTTSAVGGDQAHNNLQPYVVCYLWKRVS